MWCECMNNYLLIESCWFKRNFNKIFNVLFKLWSLAVLKTLKSERFLRLHIWYSNAIIQKSKIYATKTAGYNITEQVYNTNTERCLNVIHFTVLQREAVAM